MRTRGGFCESIICLRFSNNSNFGGAVLLFVLKRNLKSVPVGAVPELISFSELHVQRNGKVAGYARNARGTHEIPNRSFELKNTPGVERRSKPEIKKSLRVASNSVIPN